MLPFLFLFKTFFIKTDKGTGLLHLSDSDSLTVTAFQKKKQKTNSRGMLSTRILPTILNQTRRQFQTTGLRLASNALHVKSEDEFKKEVLDSKKAYVVDFHATWYVNL